MTWFPILAFAAVAVTFAIGDLISSKTKGLVSSILASALFFLIFGGTLHIFPSDMATTSGIMSLIPTFGMALILVNVGSLIDLNDLKREWKTVIFSVVGVVGVVIIGLTLGQLLFGREYALSALGPVSGGMTATMILTEAANNAGRPDLAAFVAAVMAFQMLIGLPVAAWCLRKESFRFLAAGEHLRPPREQEQAHPDPSAAPDSVRSGYPHHPPGQAGHRRRAGYLGHQRHRDQYRHHVPGRRHDLRRDRLRGKRFSAHRRR